MTRLKILKEGPAGLRRYTCPRCMKLRSNRLDKICSVCKKNGGSKGRKNGFRKGFKKNRGLVKRRAG